MSWEIFITIGHIIGTVLGVGGATFAEIFSWKLVKMPGKPDPAVSGLLQVTYKVIRLGMILLVLSGFGFLLLLRFEGQGQYIYSPRLWAKLVITLVILANALLWQAHRMPFWLGSAVSLTSWYTALILGTWRGLHAGFWEILVWYVVAIGLVAALQSLMRKKLLGAKT